jgi:hypothetical protein
LRRYPKQIFEHRRCKRDQTAFDGLPPVLDANRGTQRSFGVRLAKLKRHFFKTSVPDLGRHCLRACAGSQRPPVGQV